MKRTLFAQLAAIAFALTLAACAGSPPAPAAAASSARGTAPLRMEAVGTLSTNACEASVAADYTAVIVARRRAVADLQAQRITVQRAQRVQQIADAARAQLDAACQGGKPDAQRIAAARAALAQLKE